MKTKHKNSKQGKEDIESLARLKREQQGYQSGTREHPFHKLVRTARENIAKIQGAIEVAVQKVQAGGAGSVNPERRDALKRCHHSAQVHFIKAEEAYKTAIGSVVMLDRKNGWASRQELVSKGRRLFDSLRDAERSMDDRGQST
jgi:hypothetical protein